MTQNLRIERQLGNWMRARLPHAVAELVMFTLKQGWAALFGGLFLIAILCTSAIWQESWPLARYDALFLFAVLTQAAFLYFRLESWDEARVIVLFHIVGTAMEVFKLHMGSWAYPEPGLVKLAGVPLFSGFMYASVGSYMARVIRLFDMRFAPYPPFWLTVVLAVAIYLNFFLHHFAFDSRYFLFAATVAVFWRTRIWFFIGDNPYWMPLPVAAFCTSFFLWVAENIGTSTGTWAYAGQSVFEWVRWGKLGSWYLLLYVSFLLVTLVFRQCLHTTPVARSELVAEPEGTEA